MVDSIGSNNAATSLIRAQQSAGIAALRSNGQAAQALINELQKTSAPAPVTTNAPKLVGSSAQVLPRGSLVDKLV